jgi:bifunctional non-homologous end joining protein LigD
MKGWMLVRPSCSRCMKSLSYRLRLERDSDRVRLITRGGYNWTDRYPWIVEAALKNRVKQFVIDGEAVVLGVDGVADFDALNSGRHNDEVQLYAFDIKGGGRCRGARRLDGRARPTNPATLLRPSELVA